MDLDALRRERTRLLQAGGESRIARQHAQGKWTARERLSALFEADSFQESQLFRKHRCVHFGMQSKELPGDGVVVGAGLVDGRPVYAASQDFTVQGGTVGEVTAQKICKVMDEALKNGAPFVLICDSGGARIQEGVGALSGFGQIFYRNVQLSGVVPQISIIAGPCAGGAAYSPALSDFLIQVKGTSQLFITGPRVIEEVTGEKVTAEALGGAMSHALRSGVIHFVAEDDGDAIRICRRLLSFLPSSNREDPPVLEDRRAQAYGPLPALNAVLPEDPREAYDMRAVLRLLADDGDLMEPQALFATNVIVAFGRMGGQTVGFVANQPIQKAGVLDIDAADKAARFIRFCDAFHIPLVTLVDVPGFLPGVSQETGGIIRHGAKMLYAYSEATVPKVTVILRKAYGGAYLAMCSRDLGADRVCAWPSAEIAVMGAEGAVSVLYREELSQAEDAEQRRAELCRSYRETFANPMRAAELGMLDDIIEPADTRAYVIAALDLLQGKRESRPHKKHGLMPL